MYKPKIVPTEGWAGTELAGDGDQIADCYFLYKQKKKNEREKKT